MLDQLELSDEDLRAVTQVAVVACGSSFHAGLVAKYAFERWTRLPVEVDIASEFRYRDPVLHEKALVIGVSQSGESVDTIEALREARRAGAAKKRGSGRARWQAHARDGWLLLLLL